MHARQTWTPHSSIYARPMRWVVTCTARTNVSPQRLRSSALSTASGFTYTSSTEICIPATSLGPCRSGVFPPLSVPAESASHSACSFSLNARVARPPGARTSPQGDEDIPLSTPRRPAPGQRPRNAALVGGGEPALASAAASSVHTRDITAAENLPVPPASSTGFPASAAAPPPALPSRASPLPRPVGVPLPVPFVVIICRAEEHADSATVGSHPHLLPPALPPARHACKRHSRAVHGSSGATPPASWRIACNEIGKGQKEVKEKTSFFERLLIRINSTQQCLANRLRKGF